MLAFIIAGLVVLSLLSIFAAFIGAAEGALPDEQAGKGIWPTLEILPAFALPIAFVLLIAFFIVSGVRRSRANRRAKE